MAAAKSRPRQSKTEKAADRAPSESRADLAYSALKQRVIENAFPVGAFFLEQELADLLGMSRTPIREALVRLAHEGFVEIRPRHGMRVLPISSKDMRDIYAILTALEAEVAAELAERGLSGSELMALRGAVDQMEQALKRDDLVAWAAADARFHRDLVAASQNDRIRATITQYWEQSQRVRMSTLRLRAKPVRSTREHHALVDAIAARKPNRARKLHREHRAKAADMLAAILDRYGLSQL
ncbi:MAG: GntR family transcriptional regulator [Pseudomonadota bacterium]